MMYYHSTCSLKRQCMNIVCISHFGLLACQPDTTSRTRSLTSRDSSAGKYSRGTPIRSPRSDPFLSHTFIRSRASRSAWRLASSGAAVGSLSSNTFKISVARQRRRHVCTPSRSPNTFFASSTLAANIPTQSKLSANETTPHLLNKP